MYLYNLNVLFMFKLFHNFWWFLCNIIGELKRNLCLNIASQIVDNDVNKRHNILHIMYRKNI